VSDASETRLAHGETVGAAEAPRTIVRRRARDAAVLLALFLVVIAVQARVGAFTAELTHADEPAHFISGLVVRDYLASGFDTTPIAYVRDYYSSYPKIAIGNWPPLFYMVQGAWLLLTPAQPASVRLLMSLITAILAWLVFLVLRRELDTAHATFGAGLVVLLDPVPVFAGMVMLENLVALLAAVAVGVWVRYMDRPDTRRALAFAAAAAVAVLTKGNALFLALVPPLSIAIGRRWDLMRSRGLLIAALLVLLVAGPWLWFFLRDIVSGWQQALPSPTFIGAALAEYGRALLRVLGIAGALTLALGMWARVRPRHPAGGAIWTAAAATIIAVVLFHVLVPAGIDSRHLIPAYPALAMFVAAGAFTLSGWLRARRVGAMAATSIVLGSLSLAFALEALRLPGPSLSGYRQAAAIVLDHAGEATATTSLVVAGAAGEGSFIVEIAVRDRSRPSHTVWRGSKLLALATWAGRGYRLRTDDDTAVLTLLDQAGIRYIVIDRSAGQLRHQRQFMRIMEDHPARFTRLGTIQPRRGDAAVPGGELVVLEVLPAPGSTLPRAPAIRQAPGYDGVEALPTPASSTGPLPAEIGRQR
jgi:4-amino-4-deoxy-L-arabinose transferase-like glycosyltransferase